MKNVVLPVILVSLLLGAGPDVRAERAEIVPLHPESLKIDDELTVTRLTEGVFVFRSRPWSANSLLVVDDGGASVLVDTPAMPRTTRTLLDWAAQHLGTTPTVAVNSHYHMDASGGNAVLAERNVRIYASEGTKRHLAESGIAYRNDVIELFADEPGIQRGLREIEIRAPDETVDALGHLDLRVGKITLWLEHHGATHSSDHIAVGFPQQRVLYGGCAVRHGDSLGNIREAEDFAAWRRSIVRLQAFEPRFVIPGHGASYGPELLESTRRLLDDELAEEARRLEVR